MARPDTPTTPPAPAGRGKAVEVLIVDDSATMRRLIRTGLERDPRIRVVAEAADARAARDAVKALAPDVMTLDVEMPGMSGLDFLARLMRARPMPVIMLSSVTPAGSDAALRALSLGAVDCVEKPRFGTAERTFHELADQVVVAASARLSPARNRPPASPGVAPGAWQWNRKWILIGSSTGGVEALETLLQPFPADAPPTLITQHMPAAFLAKFATRLNAEMIPSVRLAADGDRPGRGEVLIAPGGQTHLVIDADGETLRLLEAPRRSGHRPSVDVMFASAVPFAKHMVAAILTGMGRDGAEQMRVLHDRGAVCIGQDQDTSVVYGMPRIAQELGALDLQLPLQEIAGELLRRTSARARA